MDGEFLQDFNLFYCRFDGIWFHIDAKSSDTVKPDQEKPVRYGLSPAALVWLGPVIVIGAVCLLSRLLWLLVQWFAGEN